MALTPDEIAPGVTALHQRAEPDGNPPSDAFIQQSAAPREAVGLVLTGRYWVNPEPNTPGRQKRRRSGFSRSTTSSLILVVDRAGSVHCPHRGLLIIVAYSCENARVPAGPLPAGLMSRNAMAYWTSRTQYDRFRTATISRMMQSLTPATITRGHSRRPPRSSDVHHFRLRLDRRHRASLLEKNHERATTRLTPHRGIAASR